MATPELIVGRLARDHCHSASSHFRYTFGSWEGALTGTLFVCTPHPSFFIVEVELDELDKALERHSPCPKRKPLDELA